MWTQLSKDMSLLSLQSQFLWLKYFDSISNLDLLINIKFILAYNVGTLMSII